MRRTSVHKSRIARQEYGHKRTLPNLAEEHSRCYRAECVRVGVQMASGALVTVSTAMGRRAALERFRKKKANRSYAKKVRYQARKKLAEQRPRYKGQFIKMETQVPV